MQLFNNFGYTSIDHAEGCGYPELSGKGLVSSDIMCTRDEKNA